MRNRVWVVLLSLVAGGFLTLLFSNWRHAESAEPGETSRVLAEYAIYALPMPDALSFAGEEVPLAVFDVRERLDRELLVNTYWQSQTMLFFKRANRWFPVIEPILAERGIPADFKYLALIESGLMNVVSPAGAAGFWQILEGTGRELGLEVNSAIDERYHLEKATIAACMYLQDAKNRFGSWTLAAAAYNIGNARLTRILQQQKVTDYYDLHLNEETSRYVFRILAIKTIFSDPTGSGFHFGPDDLYEPLRHYSVEVDTTITSLPDFAARYNTNYKTLRLMNPWMRDYELPNRSRKKYQIKIPVATEEK